MTLRKSPVYQTLPEVSATAQVTSDLLKTISILSDAFFRRSAVKQDHTGNQKRGHISQVDLLFKNLPKILLNAK